MFTNLAIYGSSHRLVHGASKVPLVPAAAWDLRRATGLHCHGGLSVERTIPGQGAMQGPAAFSCWGEDFTKTMHTLHYNTLHYITHIHIHII